MRWFTKILPLFLALVTAPTAINAGDACKEVFCTCAEGAHPIWIKINCTLSESQTFDIENDTLPDKTTELDIYGGNHVRMYPQSFTTLQDIRRVRIMGTLRVSVQKHAFLELTAISTILSITDCVSTHISTKAFSKIKGPVAVNISSCDYVQIEREAFSWILSVTINRVPRLVLDSGAFIVENIGADVNRHGPDMTIHLQDVSVDKFNSHVFGSSAAEVMLVNVNSNAIAKDAFSAMKYNMVVFANSTINAFEPDSFVQKTLINSFQIYRCDIATFASHAVQSAMNNMTIQNSRIGTILRGGINVNAASVHILNNEVEKIHKKGLQLSSWNILQIEKNAFGELKAEAVIANFATDANEYRFNFNENGLTDLEAESLKFIGSLSTKSFLTFTYENNYYAEPCNCEINSWFKKVMGTPAISQFLLQSHCVVNEFFARCFNVPEENIKISKFRSEVCGPKPVINCEPPQNPLKLDATKSKNTLFPSIYKQEGTAFKNKELIKTIACVITVLLLIISAIMTIVIMKKRGYCFTIKNAIISSNACGVSFIQRTFSFNGGGLDSARSISRLSVHEYSERHRLNEPRIIDIETTLPNMYAEEELVPMEDKYTQTLPEELTKELLESLRQNLDDPDNYTEAREMIEHLYELIKVEENCNNNGTNSTSTTYDYENQYELPSPSIVTTITIGRNKKEMTSVGTNTQILDRLSHSPYNRNTALCHEYFEPKDLTLHMYAEITGIRDKKNKNCNSVRISEVLPEPAAAPRGPFLKALREKNDDTAITYSTPKLFNEAIELVPQSTSTMKSNRSISSNSSARMQNRPLPKKPLEGDEGKSFHKR